MARISKKNKEMKAMIAYIEYIGKDVPKGEEAKASGIYDLDFRQGADLARKNNIRC
jgi:cytochrome c